MIVKFKKLHELAIEPFYSKYGDAGLDLTATRIITETEEQIVYGTDIAFEIPEGNVGLVFPRSSIRKYQLQLANSIGVIDSGYRGEIIVTFNKIKGVNSIKYNVGDRIGQIIILPFPKIILLESESLSETERNDGGHGHTGK